MKKNVIKCFLIFLFVIAGLSDLMGMSFIDKIHLKSYKFEVENQNEKIFILIQKIKESGFPVRRQELIEENRYRIEVSIDGIYVSLILFIESVNSSMLLVDSYLYGYGVDEVELRANYLLEVEEYIVSIIDENI